MRDALTPEAADTLVGDAAGGKTRGVSGGERKRLAIACELIDAPRLLFFGAGTGACV